MAKRKEANDDDGHVLDALLVQLGADLRGLSSRVTGLEALIERVSRLELAVVRVVETVDNRVRELEAMVPTNEKLSPPKANW